jgi:hypothetical protein
MVIGFCLTASGWLEKGLIRRHESATFFAGLTAGFSWI